VVGKLILSLIVLKTPFLGALVCMHAQGDRKVLTGLVHNGILVIIVRISTMGIESVYGSDPYLLCFSLQMTLTILSLGLRETTGKRRHAAEIASQNLTYRDYTTRASRMLLSLFCVFCSYINTHV
jgi:hypothetical protein